MRWLLALWLAIAPACAQEAVIGSGVYGGTKAQAYSAGPCDITSFAAWYGLRACSAAIAAAGTQKLVTVRNTSSNETCNILVVANGGMAGTVSGCSGGSSGTVVATFCSGGGGSCAVTTWYDQSGTGANATQATAANQPILKLSGCSSGSLPCITFASGSSNQLNATISATASPHSYTAVANRNGATSSFGIIIGLNTGDNNHLYFNNSTNTVAMQESTSGFTATASDNAFHSLIAVGNGGTSVINVDGTDTTGSTTNNTTGTQLNIGVDQGVGFFLTALVSEVAYANAAFSSGTRTSLHSNASAYWGTP